MAHISVERAHGLGKEAAREKADKLAQKLSEQYGLVAAMVRRYAEPQAFGCERRGACQRRLDPRRCGVGPDDVGHERHDQIGNREGPR